jgi:hypothetical protein
MSIRGSRSPDISAIEDRVISQSERAARLRAEAAQEAQEREMRLWEADLRTAPSKNAESRVLNRSHGGNFAAEAERVARRKNIEILTEARRLDREPCGFCGTRADKHAEFGCKRWRPGW